MEKKLLHVRSDYKSPTFGLALEADLQYGQAYYVLDINKKPRCAHLFSSLKSTRTAICFPILLKLVVITYFQNQKLKLPPELALFLYNQRVVAKWINVGIRQQAYQKLPYSTTNKRPEEYFFPTISVLTPLTGILIFQSYLLAAHFLSTLY